MRGTLAERFWAKVEKAGPDECWLWTAGATYRGYGTIKFNGKPKGAHHVAWFFKFERWPTYLLHSCDTPACVNPTHLREGDPASNMADCKAKGRNPRGIRHGRAKLNDDQVREIRRLLLGGVTKAEIGRRFGVTTRNIRSISNGEIWTHVT